MLQNSKLVLIICYCKYIRQFTNNLPHYFTNTKNVSPDLTLSTNNFKKVKINLPLTKKESEVLNDVLNYMIDYMQDRCWSTQDKLAFDRLYSKLQGALKK